MLKIIDNPTLPKEIFGVEINPELLAQAVRVYLANQRQGNQSALTRAEVNRTRRKIFKQKGTGHARHGDRKSPIFVGGGIAFAPKPRDYSLSLNGKVKVMAKVNALSAKSADKGLMVVSGMEKMTGKTRELAKFLSDIKSDVKNPQWLIITDQVRENVWRAGKNIRNMHIAPAHLVTAYQIIKANKVILMDEAVEVLSKNKTIKANKTNEAKSEEKVVKKIKVPKVVKIEKPVKKVVKKKVTVKKTK